MNVRQFRYSADNFAYLLYGDRSAVAIDGGAAKEILAFVRARGLVLTHVANTHDHGDHTVGNRGLLAGSTAIFIDNRSLRENRFILLDGEKIDVCHTPGHTSESVCFKAGEMLISGDTLFNGTVGNCFSGDLDAFYRSIKMLMGFPADTLVYAGHDYVAESMRFARWLEPENAVIDDYLRKIDSRHVFSTLRQELQVNPYLRFNAPGIIAFLEQKKLPVATEIERWTSLMAVG